MPDVTNFLSTKINLEDQDSTRQVAKSTRVLNDVGNFFLSFARGSMGGRTVSCVLVDSRGDNEFTRYPTYTNERRVEGVERALSIIATIVFLPFAVLGTILGSIFKGIALKDQHLVTRYNELQWRDKQPDHAHPLNLASEELDVALQLHSTEKIKAVLEKIKKDPNFQGWDVMAHVPEEELLATGNYNGVDLVRVLTYLTSEQMANTFSAAIYRDDFLPILSIFLKHYANGDTSNDFFKGLSDIDGVIRADIKKANLDLNTYAQQKSAEITDDQAHIKRIEKEFHSVWPKANP